jgi:hypothetical protein
VACCQNRCPMAITCRRIFPFRPFSVLCLCTISSTPETDARFVLITKMSWSAPPYSIGGTGRRGARRISWKISLLNSNGSTTLFSLTWIPNVNSVRKLFLDMADTFPAALRYRATSASRSDVWDDHLSFGCAVRDYCRRPFHFMSN